MRNVFRNDRRWIQRAVIHTRHRIIQIQIGLWFQHNRTFIHVPLISLADQRHERALFPALFRNVGRQLDPLTTHHEETNRHGADLTHLNIRGHDVNLLEDLMNQVTILNTILRNDPLFIRPLVGHAENILGRHIVLCETPLNGFILQVIAQMTLYDETVIFYFNDLEFLAIFIEIIRMIDDFKVYETVQGDALHVLGFYLACFGRFVVFFHVITK